MKSLPAAKEPLKKLCGRAAPAGQGVGHYGAQLGDPRYYGVTLRFDAGSTAAIWTKLANGVTLATGTTATVSYRVGSTPTPDATWSAPTTLTAATGGVITGTGRYLEVTVQLAASSDLKKAPAVKDMAATFKLQ